LRRPRTTPSVLRGSVSPYAMTSSTETTFTSVAHGVGELSG